MKQELTYWVALTHAKIRTSRKNEMIAHTIQQDKTIIDFFDSTTFLDMSLSQDEVLSLNNVKAELPNYSFLVEELLNQGYEIIPITSKEYSPILKSNLKYSSPIVLYTKGNKAILQEQTIAIVGSRNATETALTFTDNVAQKAVSACQTVVSGFAKGVDKQALDSALKYNGKSIIVLPQGITTFSSGMKKYYKQIIEGDVLVLSTFHPKAPWSVELAMARNAIIYGLASEIYAAQSDDKGGTWSGVCDGLKKERKIYVRVPGEKEKCANLLLIEKGANPVDIMGEPIVLNTQKTKSESEIKEDILSFLKKQQGVCHKAEEIKNQLGLTITKKDLVAILNDKKYFDQTKKGKTILYSSKSTQLTLFQNDC